MGFRAWQPVEYAPTSALKRLYGQAFRGDGWWNGIFSSGGWLAIPALVLALGGLACAEQPADPGGKNAPVVNTDHKTPESPAAKVLPEIKVVEASPDEQQKIDALLLKLDSDDFATREAGSIGLARMGLCTESTLRKVREHPPSEEVRERVDRLLSTIDATRFDFTGEWEETKKSISYKCYYRVEIQPDGRLTMRVTDYNKDQQYLFDSVEVKNGELRVHETFNPGYEFDMQLKPVSKDRLVGTGTRRSDNLVLVVEYNRVTKPPANP